MFRFVRDETVNGDDYYGWYHTLEGPGRFRAFGKRIEDDIGYDAGVYTTQEEAIAAVYYMSILIRTPMHGNA
jgi:hypothetical protein